MNVERLISDLGNSTSMFMFDGQYFELPSAVKEIPEAEVKGAFAENVEDTTLQSQLIIRVQLEGKDRFFAVGEKAQEDTLGSSHIEALHDKTTSEVPFILWVASTLFYHAWKHPTYQERATIQVENMYTMIPTWIAKKSDRFKVMIEKMAKRFETTVEAELLTAGYEREAKIVVLASHTRIEGETARMALKYGLNLKPQESAKRFNNSTLVLNDVGGQTQDLAKLQKGLARPSSSDDFQSFTDISFLKELERLRKDKLMTYFTDIRSLEKFILDNAESRKYIYTDPTSWHSEDLTPYIEPTLRRFTKVVIEKCLTAFKFRQGEDVFFVHFGGVIELLEVYVKEYLIDRLGKSVAQERHMFPKDGRLLNLYGCEIVAKNDIAKRGLASGKQKETV